MQGSRSVGSVADVLADWLELGTADRLINLPYFQWNVGEGIVQTLMLCFTCGYCSDVPARTEDNF